MRVQSAEVQPVQLYVDERVSDNAAPLRRQGRQAATQSSRQAVAASCEEKRMRARACPSFRAPMRNRKNSPSVRSTGRPAALRPALYVILPHHWPDRPAASLSGQTEQSNSQPSVDRQSGRVVSIGRTVEAMRAGGRAG